MTDTECVFCKVITGELPSHKVYEDESILAILDISPLNPGHTLFIPKRHTTNIAEMSAEEVGMLYATARRLAPGMMKSVGAESFNLSTNVGRAAGQVVFHTHVHLIPRYPADGYEPWMRNDKYHQDLGSVAEKMREQMKDGTV